VHEIKLSIPQFLTFTHPWMSVDRRAACRFSDGTMRDVYQRNFTKFQMSFDIQALPTIRTSK
jgi:hypothetical protein